MKVNGRCALAVGCGSSRSSLVVCRGACTKKPNLSPGEVKAVRAAALAAAPADAAWAALPVHVAPLVLQDLVEPRLLKATTPEVRVRAMHDGTNVAFLLEWADATKNDLPGPARFTDACAVQFPATPPARDLPAPQMGEKGRGVEITYWRASWQAVVDGRGDTLRDLYPNATVDHYPFEADEPRARARPSRRRPRCATRRRARSATRWRARERRPSRTSSPRARARSRPARPHGLERQGRADAHGLGRRPLAAAARRA